MRVRTEDTGCVSRGTLQLYARWRSPRQETTLLRSDNMLSLTRAWPSSLRVGRLSNDVPLPRLKSWRWSHRSRPPLPPHHSAAISTKRSLNKAQGPKFNPNWNRGRTSQSQVRQFDALRFCTLPSRTSAEQQRNRTLLAHPMIRAHLKYSDLQSTTT